MRRTREQRKEALKSKILREIKDWKSRNKVYRFNENFNEKSLFWFDKSLIIDGHWAELPKSAKSVFPVIASYCNKQGNAWPSDVTIGILCGRTIASVCRGTKDLSVFWSDIFKTKKPKSTKKKYKKKYILTLPIKPIPEQTFPFYQYIIESGVWCQLKPTAQALYPVIKYFSRFNKRDCEYLEGVSYHDPNEAYKKRKYDLLAIGEKNKAYKTITELAFYSGISRPSVYSALQDLEKNWLIKKYISDDGLLYYKVFIKTKDMKYHKRKDLNKSARMNFRYLLIPDVIKSAWPVS